MAIRSAKASSNGNDLKRFEQILLERRRSPIKDARSIEREEERVREGSFGIRDACGESIPKARLEPREKAEESLAE